MRVIAGTARGRSLRAPGGDGTRPTPDRVREALFSMLGAHLPSARVLDLFAGTGALGIEALSRGAAHATFVENDRAALSALRRNLELLPVADSRVIASTLPLALDRLSGEQPFDLVFLDPPYAATDLLARTLARAVELLDGDGVAICEHPGGAAASRARPAPPAGWRALETRSWGDVAVTLMGVSAA